MVILVVVVEWGWDDSYDEVHRYDYFHPPESITQPAHWFGRVLCVLLIIIVPLLVYARTVLLRRRNHRVGDEHKSASIRT
jgi:hypothetical protein